MDNKKLFEGLLKADGIDPAGASESEHVAFAKMLDRQLKSKQSKQGIALPDIWRIIMKNKITKLVVAAVVVIAAIIGINQFSSSGIAWAEIVQKTEQSYNKYYSDLLTAAEKKNLAQISSNADALSEFWQGIHILAKAKLDPTIQLQPEDSLNIIKLTFGKTEFDAIDKNAIQEYGLKFLGWFNRIKDEAWTYETIHISKQMEEYAEEIRDGGRDPKLDLPYAEHSLIGFTAYCEWFERLPWNDPEQSMSPDVLLIAIERDLGIARQEITALKIRGVDRFVMRGTQQVQRNVHYLSRKIMSDKMVGQWKLCQQLNQKVEELHGLMIYLTVASEDITLTNKYNYPEVVHQILTQQFAGEESFAAYFIEQIDCALDLCKTLKKELGYAQ